MAPLLICPTPDAYQAMWEDYASILEKTNQQLSLWFNPYALMVGIVTLLFAIGAIIVTIVLWRQSQEQRSRAERFYEEQKKRMEDIDRKASEERARVTKESENKLQELIAESQERLQKATGHAKDRLEETLVSLKRDKALVGSVPLTYSIPPGMSGVFSTVATEGMKTVCCVGCGKKFSYIVSTFGSVTNTRGQRIQCSYCGALNTVE